MSPGQGRTVAVLTSLYVALACVGGATAAERAVPAAGWRETLSDPAMRHAAIAHFPVVLFVASVPAALLAFRRSRGWRVQLLALFVTLVVVCLLGEASGESAEARVPAGANGVPADAWEEIGRHARAAEWLKLIAACGALAALASLVPKKHLRPGWHPQRLACLAALVAAIAGAIAAAQTAHLGGLLVYRHAIGSPLPRQPRDPSASAPASATGWPYRSAFRLRFEPERRYDHVGCRVAAVPLAE